MITKASLAAKLRRLGSTPDAIAKELERRGFKGLPCDSQFCPVAKFLSQTTQKAKRASVGQVSATVFFQKTAIGVTVPRAVTEFVRRFDAREYPSLLAY